MRMNYRKAKKTDRFTLSHPKNLHVRIIMTTRRHIFASSKSSLGVLWAWPHERQMSAGITKASERDLPAIQRRGQWKAPRMVGAQVVNAAQFAEAWAANSPPSLARLLLPWLAMGTAIGAVLSALILNA